MKFYLSLHKQESYLFLLLGYNTIISIEIWPMNIFFSEGLFYPHTTTHADVSVSNFLPYAEKDSNLNRS